MTLKHKNGNFNNFDYYQLPSLPDIDILLAESHDQPNLYNVSFIDEKGRCQDLCEEIFDNKSQAVKFAKDILLDDYY